MLDINTSESEGCTHILNIAWHIITDEEENVEVIVKPKQDNPLQQGKQTFKEHLVCEVNTILFCHMPYRIFLGIQYFVESDILRIGTPCVLNSV